MTQEAPATPPVIPIEQAGQHAGRSVTIRGWLYNLRESGKLLFPIFRDGTGVIQGVVSQKENPAAAGLAGSGIRTHGGGKALPPRAGLLLPQSSAIAAGCTARGGASRRKS